MSPVIVACVLAACLIPHASVAQERRPTSAPAATTPAEDLCQLHPYNIKNLTSKAFWFTNASVSQICSDPNATFCTLYFSFCKALKLSLDTTHCDGSAVCLVSRDAKGKELHDFSLGQFLLNETQFYETNDTESGGFYMEVKSGSTVPQCNNTGVSTRIELLCDPSAQWNTQDLTKNNISNVELDDMCSYKITLRYAGACLPHNPTSMPLSPTPAPTPTPTSSTAGPTNSSSMPVTHTNTSSMTTTAGPTNLSSTTVSHTPSSMTTSTSSSSSPSSGTTSVTSHGTKTATTPIVTSQTSQSTQSQTGSVPGTVSPTTTITTVPPVTPTTPPLPPHHTTNEKPTKPRPSTSEPTANPLASKVSGLTAGIVVFALLFFAMILVAVGLVWYFKFHNNRYHKLPNEDL